MASLLRDIAVSGVRKSDGSAAASAKIWCLTPGASSTSSTATVYSDKDGLVTLGQPITADAGGRAVIYVKAAVRLYIEDASGNVLLQEDRGDTIAAGQVEVENSGFTGTILSGATVGSQATGGRTNLATVLDSAHTSTNGPDFKYLESAGATARPIRDKFAEVWISVKDFLAVGNGVADDTAAIQAAINRVSALGGGIVYFPPGNYKTTTALLMTSMAGVSLQGAGYSISNILNTSATGNGLTMTSCSSMFLRGLSVGHSTSSTGAAIAAAGCALVVFDGIGTGNHQIGIDFSSSAARLELRACTITASVGATSRAIRYNTTGTSTYHVINGGALSAPSGKGIEFNGTVSRVTVSDVNFPTNNGSHVLFNAALTGTIFAFYANPAMSAGGSPQFDLSGLATDPRFEQWGNGVDGYTQNVASGGTATVDRSLGSDIRLRATSTGVAIVIPAPTPAPSTAMRNVFLTLTIVNNAGGAMTAYTVDAVYHLVAAPSTVNNEITTYRLRWDPDATVWRQTERSVTT